MKFTNLPSLGVPSFSRLVAFVLVIAPSESVEKRTGGACIFLSYRGTSPANIDINLRSDTRHLRERETERERERERDRQRQRQRERKRKSEWERERQRQRESQRKKESQRKRERDRERSDENSLLTMEWYDSHSMSWLAIVKFVEVWWILNPVIQRQRYSSPQ